MVEVGGNGRKELRRKPPLSQFPSESWRFVKKILNKKVKSFMITYDNIQKIITGDYDTAGCLLDYLYLKNTIRW